MRAREPKKRHKTLDPGPPGEAAVAKPDSRKGLVVFEGKGALKILRVPYKPGKPYTVRIEFTPDPVEKKTRKRKKE